MGEPHCHHREYFKDGRELSDCPLTAFVTLCRQCHAKSTHYVDRVRLVAHLPYASVILQRALDEIDYP
jgi:hypothetical protein